MVRYVIVVVDVDVTEVVVDSEATRADAMGVPQPVTGSQPALAE